MLERLSWATGVRLSTGVMLLGTLPVAAAPLELRLAAADHGVLAFEQRVSCQTATGGATSATVSANEGDRYFLVVPLDAESEGSYGTESTGSERDSSNAACKLAQVVGGCS